ncbi:hypothetical protein ACETPF_17760 [Sphingobium sp. sgz301304]
MRRPSDTPPDTPAPGLLFAIEAIGVALLLTAAAVAAIVDFFRA